MNEQFMRDVCALLGCEEETALKRIQFLLSTVKDCTDIVRHDYRLPETDPTTLVQTLRSLTSKVDTLGDDINPVNDRVLQLLAQLEEETAIRQNLERDLQKANQLHEADCSRIKQLKEHLRLTHHNTVVGPDRWASGKKQHEYSLLLLIEDLHMENNGSSCKLGDRYDGARSELHRRYMYWKTPDDEYSSVVFDLVHATLKECNTREFSPLRSNPHRGEEE